MASNRVIVNVGIGHWYPNGTHRLVQSLHQNGYDGSIMEMTSLPEGWESHDQNPYSFKVRAVEQAINAGYRLIFWMDSSIISLTNPNHIFEIIAEHGYYFTKTGYSIGQSTSDQCLKWFGITRDQAMELPEIASGFWGLDMQRPYTKEIFNTWKSACEAGCFKGNRVHDTRDSEDTRFLFHRQDQSALSCAILPHRFNLDSLGNRLTYELNVKKRTEENLFLCHGM